MSEENPRLSLKAHQQWLAKYWPEFDAILPSSTPLNASHKVIAAQFVDIILKHANHECVAALTKYFAKLTFDRPQDVCTYRRILKVINGTPTIKKMPITQCGQASSFHGCLVRLMGEDINDGLEGVDSESNGLENLSITPDNIFLTTSLFGATTLAVGLHKLAHIPYSFIRIGLGEVEEPGQQTEVAAVLACIYFAVAGSKVMEQRMFKDGHVATALKSLKKDNIIRSTTGIALLQRAIENADGGFTQDISGREAWKILFPSTE